MNLQILTLGMALGDVEHGAREIGGNNLGPYVKKYLANCDPPIHVAAPYCAGWIQFRSDGAAKRLRVANPLDAVKQEALVLSYYEWARDTNQLVPADQVRMGDLVFFDFRIGGNPWDHIGLVLHPPGSNGIFETVEANTSPQPGSDEAQRDATSDGGVYVKLRTTKERYPTAFARWAR